MADDRKASAPDASFALQVDKKLARKLRAQRENKPGVWFGLGMPGLIGWSVALPTVLGAMLGIWLDRHHPGGHSWTLALLVAGLVLGCANAWRWMFQENASMHEETEVE
jgi:ATP synthase protein I